MNREGRAFLYAELPEVVAVKTSPKASRKLQQLTAGAIPGTIGTPSAES